MLPVIALVGRPNVGKSTLFNRLTRSRDAIVADFPGLTRDRQYGQGRVGRMPYIVVDTGGFEPVKSEGIVKAMASQAELAIDEADVVIFVCDARSGLTPHDQRIAVRLRQSGRKVILVVNKAEGLSAVAAAEFYELGFGEPWLISAAHGQGVNAVMDLALEGFEEEPEDEEDDDPDAPKRLKVTLAGRPNAGKSTLINALIGEERLIAFDMPGTTRDAIRVDFEYNGRPYELVDTAGLRKKGKVFEAIEKFSVVKTFRPSRTPTSSFSSSTPRTASPIMTPTLRATYSTQAAPSSSPSTSGTSCPTTTARCSTSSSSASCTSCAGPA